MDKVEKPHGTLTPAYNRDYSCAEDFLKDWNANKDFVLHNHVTQTYINRQDAERYGGNYFQIRFLQVAEISVLKREPTGKWTVFKDEDDPEDTN